MARMISSELLQKYKYSVKFDGDDFSDDVGSASVGPFQINDNSGKCNPVFIRKGVSVDLNILNMPLLKGVWEKRKDGSVDIEIDIFRKDRSLDNYPSLRVKLCKCVLSEYHMDGLDAGDSEILCEVLTVVPTYIDIKFVDEEEDDICLLMKKTGLGYDDVKSLSVERRKCIASGVRSTISDGGKDD